MVYKMDISSILSDNDFPILFLYKSANNQWPGFVDTFLWIPLITFIDVWTLLFTFHQLTFLKAQAIYLLKHSSAANTTMRASYHSNTALKSWRHAHCCRDLQYILPFCNLSSFNVWPKAPFIKIAIDFLLLCVLNRYCIFIFWIFS